MTPDPPRPAYLPQLTGLRFIAAIAVVFCHFSSLILPVEPAWLSRFNMGLYNAVSLFFVLSGFILAHTYGAALVNKSVSVSKYLFARFTRIYPVFVFALLLDLPVFYVNNHLEFVGSTKYHLIQKIALLQTWVPGPNEVSMRWNAPSWSLSTETFFYLVFPFLVGLIYKLKPKASVVLLVGSLMVTTAISFGFDYGLAAKYPSSTDLGQTIRTFIGTNPLVRTLEFVAGIALYNLYRAYKTDEDSAVNVSWNWTLLVSTAVFTLVNVYGTDTVIGQGVCTAFFAFVILGLSLERFSMTTVLQSPTAVLLGEASYSLYLIHFPIFYTAFAMFRNVSFLENLRIHHPCFVGIPILAITIFASIVCYKLIEAPTRKFLMARYFPSKSPARG